MVLKTLKLPYSIFDPIPDNRAFTVVELITILTIISILAAIAYFIVNPAELSARGRDQQRISDLAMLDRAFSEYKFDYGRYPDTVSTLRTSTSLPDGQTGPLSSPTSGWIVGSFDIYMSRLPLDPVNDSQYFYSYMWDGYTYELNATLETLIEYAQQDGGDNAAIYEVGDNLTII